MRRRSMSCGAAQELHQLSLQRQDLADKPIVQPGRSYDGTQMAEIPTSSFRCLAHSPANSVRAGLASLGKTNGAGQQPSQVRPDGTKCCFAKALCRAARSGKKGGRVVPPPLYARLYTVPLIAETDGDGGVGTKEAAVLVFTCIDAAIHGAEEHISLVAHADFCIAVLE
jgi:hypothetical protein